MPRRLGLRRHPRHDPRRPGTPSPSLVLSRRKTWLIFQELEQEEERKTRGISYPAAAPRTTRQQAPAGPLPPDEDVLIDDLTEDEDRLFVAAVLDA
jgi:hypothetical protein